MQGAGTIGGILAADLNGTTAFYCYDANGNVSDLVGTNGSSVAHYEYDPFGNTIAQSGTLADENPFRFSTKYLDDETGFYHYGYRYYSPELGRWISRDPIGERGGSNLVVAHRNNALTLSDPLGEDAGYWPPEDTHVPPVVVEPEIPVPGEDPHRRDRHHTEYHIEHIDWKCLCRKSFFPGSGGDAPSPGSPIDYFPLPATVAGCASCAAACGPVAGNLPVFGACLMANPSCGLCALGTLSYGIDIRDCVRVKPKCYRRTGSGSVMYFYAGYSHEYDDYLIPYTRCSYEDPSGLNPPVYRRLGPIEDRHGTHGHLDGDLRCPPSITEAGRVRDYFPCPEHGGS